MTQKVLRLSDFYDPLPKQRIFHESRAKYKCYMGGFGSGKTHALVMEALLLSLEYPRNYGLIGRFTYPELRDTTMKDFFEVCPPLFIKRFVKTENKLIFQNGSIIIFRHLEDADKLKSLNLGWFGIDEMTETPEDVFDMLRSRLRYRGVPRHVGFGSTNPEGTDWVWNMFCKRHRNNPKYLMVNAPSTENVHLPEDYVEDLCEGMPQYWIDRYIKGDPTAFSGQIITPWDEKIHVIEPFDIPDDWSRTVVLDHGTNNPTCVVWYAINPEGFKIAYKEHYVAGQTIEWHAEQIVKLNGSDNVGMWLADPAIFNRTLQNPVRGLYSVADAYTEYGLHFSPGDNDVKAGIQALLDNFKIHDHLINPFTQEKGSPKIFLTKNCEAGIFEIPQYRWKKFRIRGQYRNKPEEPEKSHDHFVDNTRYYLMSKPKPYQHKTKGLKPFPPKSERRWDKLEKKNKKHAYATKHIAVAYERLD